MYSSTCERYVSGPISSLVIRMFVSLRAFIQACYLVQGAVMVDGKTVSAHELAYLEKGLNSLRAIICWKPSLTLNLSNNGWLS